MFGKKEKKAESKPEKKSGTETAVSEHPVTPKDILISHIEKIEAGKSIAFILPKDFGDWQLVIELNPNYPKKGKKYLAVREDLAGGNPTGKKFPQFDTNQPREIAEWVIDRKAKLRQA